MVVSKNLFMLPSVFFPASKEVLIMGKLIKNDRELTEQLERFFKRLRSACDQSTPTGKYFAHIANTLSEQGTSFFASVEVRSYGQLKTPCSNNLPYYIDTDKLIKRVSDYVDDCRMISLARNPASSDFIPSQYATYVLSPDWPSSVYGTAYEDGVIWIGKRHPYKIAQEALKNAALYNSDRLLDKALYALGSYITIDTSIFEVFKRVAQCYEDNWGESDIDAPCELSVLTSLFDPYSKSFNPQLNYLYKEKLITPELIVNIANLL